MAELADDGSMKEEPVAGNVPLTPIQQWFFEQNLEEPAHYNQAFLLEVSSRWTSRG